jgi:hypothetical protein
MMEQLNKFDINSIPIHKIIFTLTSEEDYSMQRLIVAEDFPKLGDFIILYGSHCSCYDFDETEWDATIVSEEEEIKALIKGWLKQQRGLEFDMAKLLIEYDNDFNK